MVHDLKSGSASSKVFETVEPPFLVFISGDRVPFLCDGLYFNQKVIKSPQRGKTLGAK